MQERGFIPIALPGARPMHFRIPSLLSSNGGLYIYIYIHIHVYSYIFTYIYIYVCTSCSHEVERERERERDSVGWPDRCYLDMIGWGVHPNQGISSLPALRGQLVKDPGLLLFGRLGPYHLKLHQNTFILFFMNCIARGSPHAGERVYPNCIARGSPHAF